MTFENSRKSSKYKENNVGGDLKFIISSTVLYKESPINEIFGENMH